MKDESRRDYTMSDSELCMFTSNLVQKLTRDLTDFTARGVDAAAIAALEALGDAFEIFPPDTFYQADVSIAVESKNATRADLAVKVRDVVQCSIIKWGEGSPQYRKFGAASMSSMGDMKFLTMCRLVVTTATAYLADLTAVGLTQIMIDAVDTGSQTYEDDLNAVNDAVEARDIKTDERTANGNTLYALVAKYCRIGKIIFDDVDTAKYNDYIIYHSAAGVPGKVSGLTYDLPTSTLGWAAAPKADSYQAEYKSVTPGFEWATVYEGAGLSCVHAPGTGSWLYRCRGVNAEGSGEWSDELIVLVPI